MSDDIITGDSIVDEVYAIRAKIAEECEYDVQRIAEQAHEAASKIPGLRYVTVEEIRTRRPEPAKLPD